MARYRVIVISSVENHEALRSGQLPNVVSAHEGFGVFDARRGACPEKAGMCKSYNPGFEIMPDILVVGSASHLADCCNLNDSVFFC